MFHFLMPRNEVSSDVSGKHINRFNNLADLMRRHPLFSFFLMAYAFNWVMLIPFVLGERDILPKGNLYMLSIVFHTFAPTFAAHIMIRLTQGKQGWQNLRRRLRQWRLGWQWYILILLGIPAAMLFGILVLPGGLASFQGLSPLVLAKYPFLFVLIFFGGGPLGEEIGWRGFALPHMQSRFGVLRAALLLGFLWTFWHLPEFLTPAQRGGLGTGLFPFVVQLPIFFIEVMAVAIIFNWVFNRTGGSLFAVILLHASYDTFGTLVQPLFSASIVTSTDLPFAIGMGTLALVILIATRGQLGYQVGQEVGV